MVRAIDADALLNEAEYDSNFRLVVSVDKINNAPTLTQPNEPLTLEDVAVILAEQFGDECACNFNGNDEWLPEVCRYGDVCPHPPEYLGCWMEFLRNRNRRPPEGEEDT